MENKTMLNVNPLVFTIDDFISADECAHIINISKHKVKRSSVCGENGGYISDVRTSKNCFIPYDHDDIIYSLAQRFSDLVQIPLKNAEDFQVVYYQEGDKYEYHSDSFCKAHKKYLLRGGQRTTTALAYLNDVEEGGETGFDKLNLSVAPKQGKILVFKNCITNTNRPHPLSSHAGLPVIKGEKWAFNLWFRKNERNL